MTSRLRWIAALAVAVAIGCTGKTGPAGTATGTISGQVTNDVGPLAGATVEIQPGALFLTTGADGRYAATVPVGIYAVAASAGGYLPESVTGLSLVAGATQSLSFLLRPDPGPPVVARAGTDRFQAGFGTVVTLDASLSGPEGRALNYSWRQVPPADPDLAVTLTGASTATPSFTTKTVAELIAGGLYAPREGFGTLGFSEADVATITYEFEVTVDDGATEDTDRVLIRPVVSQPGLTVVPVDTVVPLSAPEQPDGYAWTCSRQEGPSQVACEPGTLAGAGTRYPTFRAPPLGAGLYTFTSSAAAGAPVLEVRAASYIGSRPITTPATLQTCSTCHDADITTSGASPRTLTPKYSVWSETKHAKYLARALDLGQIPGYREECIRCHTTGYNPEATAGGFAQVARRGDVAWGFENGNYSGMPDQLKALAGVGCENCHGPGSLHRDGPSLASIGKSFAAIDCAQCHATEPYENQGLQWVNSRHSQFISGFRPDINDPALRGTCASCHSSQGFVAWSRTGVNTAPPAGIDLTEPQTCSACHDPHGEALTPEGGPTPQQLRVYGEVITQVPGLGARDVGPAALCITCHNSRNGVTLATEGIGGPATQVAPHAPSQADVLLAKNAATLGSGPYPSSVHTGVPKLCVGCHMAPTPPLGTPSHNKVGGHTFSVGNSDFANLAACTGCHPGLATFNRTAYGDYDGNGILEGVQSEVTGLAEAVREQLSIRAGLLWPVETEKVPDLPSLPEVLSFHGRIRVLKHFTDGLSDPVCNPASGTEFPESCFAFAAGALPQTTADEFAFLQAAWNYFLVQGDRSRGVHNTAFTVSVLQRSYQALAGVPVPGATLR